ncbi:cupin domain-containing protein [Streptomyces sp. NPDC051322]|uniref:cupin domain-containing protein n=1 Tax=Streptomyces sp. NPDC051322 TaxID=3154645 RepID=UPI00344D7230
MSTTPEAKAQLALIAAEALQPHSPKTPRMRSRWIKRPDRGGWNNYAISEWELIAAGFTDLHPHDETNLVLAGELHVEVDGVGVIGRAGDSIVVPAGSTGRYWAPHYARMVGIYGPNPDGEPSEYLEYWETGDTTGTTETTDDRT